MESWVPLLDIFMNSTCPETEASLWLQSSFNPSSNPSISISISTASFLALLMQSTEADVVCSPSSSSSSLPSKHRFMWIQTLPNAVQARILSFLTYEHAKFNKQDLSKLARDILYNETVVDFWVNKAAHQLFDVVSDSNSKWVSSFNLDSEEEKFEASFGAVPGWLKDAANSNDPILPWLPISVDDLNTKTPHITSEDDEYTIMEVEEGKDGNFESIESTHREIDPIDHETEETALCLKTRILNMESSLKAAEIADDIQKLCVKRKGESLKVLDLIQPWNVNDEVIPILLSHLLNGKEDEFEWTSNILCSILLPKFLTLEKPASRILVSATIDYCKVHHKAAVYALLFPLILHKNGINTPICDVITKIVKECLHPAHVSAFCQKLLSEDELDGKRHICPPCYQHLVCEKLVWTELLFTLFQNILNHNVHLSQDSVDQIVFKIQESAKVLSKSLKFANFLLCFVTKCGSLLKIHKAVLSEAVGDTSSFLKKSILSKLDSI
ncbi:uncharacterized protein LOC111905706 [Lactuca sativa]|uniref:Fanconi Anaemia group E protein C-terminal domain-containing protein n=1 Tax=Lactuca sativa TaxID=4236 RepID=A0A9R1UZQ5_LACSA|nr:uncharacterized protein LOC111905706 [Lactuca sativa]KAJ0195735.1 hypothetical protein LSAT_V11C700357440 [Lactuca sativa]